MPITTRRCRTRGLELSAAKSWPVCDSVMPLCPPGFPIDMRRRWSPWRENRDLRQDTTTHERRLPVIGGYAAIKGSIRRPRKAATVYRRPQLAVIFGALEANLGGALYEGTVSDISSPPPVAGRAIGQGDIHCRSQPADHRASDERYATAGVCPAMLHTYARSSAGRVSHATTLAPVGASLARPSS
jgi:hypothetical protein